MNRPATASGGPAGPRWMRLLGVLTVLALGFLGTRALWEPDEGRYAEVGREMLLSGNYLVPTLNQVPHFTKPPLTYWVIAAGLRAVGANEWGARLYLAVAFVATAWLTARLGERFCGAAAGRWAGLVYATMLLPFAAASMVTPDTLLVLWQTAALACFWRAWSAPGGATARRWMAGSWIAIGAGFLTKGPPGLLPVLVIGLFLGLARRSPGSLPWRAWLSPTGLALCLAVAAPWFGLVAVTHESLGHYLLWQEGVARVLSDAHHRNSRWYMAGAIYGPTLLVGALPWWLTLGLPRVRGGTALRAALGRVRTDPPRLFLALWILVPIGALSLASSRLPFYLLVVFPPLAIAIARAWSRASGPRRRWCAGPPRPAILTGWITVLLALRLGSAWWPTPVDAGALARWIAPHLGPRPAEVVVVDERIYGLSFYLGVPVELVTSRQHGPPAYWAPEGWAIEMAELGTTPRRHLFVVPTKLAGALTRALAGVPIACQEVAARAKRQLIACDPPGRPPVRLAVWLEGPAGAGSRFRAMDTLRELDECCGLDRALLLRDAADRPGFRRVLDGYEAWPLESRGIPVDIVAPGPGLVRAGVGPSRGDRAGAVAPARDRRRTRAAMVYPRAPEPARVLAVTGSDDTAAQWRVVVLAGCDDPPAAAAGRWLSGAAGDLAPEHRPADAVLGFCAGGVPGAGRRPDVMLVVRGATGEPVPAAIALRAEEIRDRVLVFEFTRARLDVRLVAADTGRGVLLQRVPSRGARARPDRPGTTAADQRKAPRTS